MKPGSHYVTKLMLRVTETVSKCEQERKIVNNS